MFYFTFMSIYICSTSKYDYLFELGWEIVHTTTTFFSDDARVYRPVVLFGTRGVCSSSATLVSSVVTVGGEKTAFVDDDSFVDGDS